MSPDEVVCPVCNAKKGMPCNVPTDTGRRNVQYFHLRRVDRAEEATDEQG